MNLKIYAEISKKYAAAPFLSDTMPVTEENGYQFHVYTGPMYRHNFDILRKREPLIFKLADDFYGFTANVKKMVKLEWAEKHISAAEILKNAKAGEYLIFPHTWATFMEKQRALTAAIIKKFGVAGTFSPSYKSAFFHNSIPEEFLVSRACVHINEKDPLNWFNLGLKLNFPPFMNDSLTGFRLRTKYPNKNFLVSDFLGRPHTSRRQYFLIIYNVNDFESLNSLWDAEAVFLKLVEFFKIFSAKIVFLQNFNAYYEKKFLIALNPANFLTVGRVLAFSTETALFSVKGPDILAKIGAETVKYVAAVPKTREGIVCGNLDKSIGSDYTDCFGRQSDFIFPKSEKIIWNPAISTHYPLGLPK
jgi:hypothetical protein